MFASYQFVIHILEGLDNIKEHNRRLHDFLGFEELGSSGDSVADHRHVLEI